MGIQTAGTPGGKSPWRCSALPGLRPASGSCAPPGDGARATATGRSRRPARLGLPQILVGKPLSRRPALALRGTGEEPVIIEAGSLTVSLKLEPRAGQPAYSPEDALRKLYDAQLDVLRRIQPSKKSSC